MSVLDEKWSPPQVERSMTIGGAAFISIDDGQGGRTGLSLGLRTESFLTATHVEAAAAMLGPRAEFVSLCPEMGRALLDIEWRGANVGDVTACPECCAEPSAQARAGRTLLERDDGTYVPGYAPEHKPTCKLGALCDKLRELAKAGA